MFILEADRMNPGMYIFLSVIIILITLGLIYLLYRSIKKENKRFKDEKVNQIEGLISKGELSSDVAAYISRSAAAEFSLMYVDIDKFSNVYNAFGKDESDKILQKVAYTILDNLPPRVKMARIKDDDFVIFAKGEYSHDEVEELANKLLEAINKPIQIFGDNEISISASIGVSYYPMHGSNYNNLLKDAEIAVYICKRQGGNCYRVYSLENTNESENLSYYNQIKKGIKNKEFCLYFQPMIDCEKKTIYGAEGLLRWNHPEYGVLSPHNFINIMEQSGDIEWVGLWGLEEVFKTLEKLSLEFPGLDLKLSFNLSPKQLMSETLIMDFQKIMKKSKISAHKVIFEIEEFALFEKHAALNQNIVDLSKLGFKIAIDGFGLDYSTLSKLAQLPIDVIKIDNDFLNDEENSYIMDKFANMLIDYADEEHKLLVTEGIENKEMLDKALNMRINVMQGYYMGKPMPVDELEEYITNEGWLSVLSEEEKEPMTVEDVVSEKKVTEEPVIEEVQEEEAQPSTDDQPSEESVEEESDEETQAEEAPVEEEKTEE